MSSNHETDVFSKLVGHRGGDQVQQHLNKINQKYSLRVTEDFVQRHGDIMEFTQANSQFAEDSVVEEIKFNMTASIGNQGNRMRKIKTIAGLMDATTTEKRFISAEPEFNQILQLGVSEGYKEVDLTEMNEASKQRRDYQLIKSGVCGESIDDVSIGIYEDTLTDETDAIDFRSKLNMLQTFATVRKAIDENINFAEDGGEFI